MSLASGSHLGIYEILGPLGAGGMGEVYRARDVRLGRDVAIKVLPTGVAAFPDRSARFEREARAIAQLNHPNIVTLFSAENEAGVRFLTMELVEGRRLFDLLTPGGLPLPMVLQLAIPLTEALVAAHERGIIHRDLKPGNVMVTHEGRVKVLDFGLAKMTAHDEPCSDEAPTASEGNPLTKEGHVLGTVPYMAPEQLRGTPLDARSDLFALGVILYEMVAGRHPFSGDSSVEIASSILRDAPEPLRRARPDMPEELERIVNGCLEKNPRERVQTALDVYNALRRLQESPRSGGRVPPRAEGAASIAVLPFLNRSANADDEYFSDGLSDELVNVLAKIKGLRVTARTSSFHFKDKDVTIAEIGKALNVATVLEGSVRKAGNRVRISAQLVRVSDSSHLWSETYDRTLEDIFAVQDDIARSVVGELRTALLGEPVDSAQARDEVAQAVKGRKADPEAHRLYLFARYLIDRLIPEDTTKGIEHLKQALALDPEFALAWAELGRAYASEANFGWVPVLEGFRRAKDAVLRALSLEPDLAEGHSLLGMIQINHEWDFRGTQESHARALALAPGNSRVLSRSGALAMILGRFDEGVAFYHRALEADPLNANTYVNLGFALYNLGRSFEAEAAYRRARELAPQRPMLRAHLSLVLLDQGRGEEALSEASQERHESFRLWSLAIVHHGMGNTAKSDEALREEIEKDATGGAFQIAEVYGARGEVDAAFAWLERAFDQRDAGLFELKASPRLRSLHRDPRWGLFLAKMGLES